MRGSTISLLGRHGNTEASYDFDAYGVVYGRGAAEREIAAVPGRPSVFRRGTDYLYTGKRHDAATGLYDYGFRDYAPRLARFTSVDPVKDGRNWYAYVGADPVNMVDPLGLAGQRESTTVEVDATTRAAPQERPKFGSADEAAIDFSENYNDDAIRNDIEYGTTIFKTPEGDFYYSVPNEGDVAGVDPRTDPERETDEVAAHAHTHGALNPDYASERFSSRDEAFAEATDVPLYISTPAGRMMKYDPRDDSTVTLPNQKVPSDLNTGTDRQTQVDPETGITNPANRTDRANTQRRLEQKAM